MTIEDMKRCSVCKKQKEKTAFGKKTAMGDGLNYQCKDCANEYGRTYRKKYKKRVSLANKRWYRTHLKAARAQSYRYYKSSKTTKRKCALCGKEFLAAKSQVRDGFGILCSLPCNARWANRNSYKRDTAIEIKMEKHLKDLGVEFKKKAYVIKNGGINDFYLPKHRIIIECDGDYWHNLENMKIRDAKKDFTLTVSGFKVFRVWEHEIHRGWAWKKKLKKLLASQT